MVLTGAASEGSDLCFLAKRKTLLAPAVVIVILGTAGALAKMPTAHTLTNKPLKHLGLILPPLTLSPVLNDFILMHEHNLSKH